MSVATAVVFLVVLFCFFAIPGYVIGKRRDVKNPWVAFVPIFGFWIVLFESIDKNAWWALVVLLPYLGALVVMLWTAWEVPVHHDRSRWWRVVLMIPGVNFFAYWVYALTLEDTATASFAY